MIFLRKAIDLLFPKNAVCMGCASPLGVYRDWLCEDCIPLLLPATHFGGARCPVCGRFSARGFRCKACKDWPKESVSRAYFVYQYGPPVDSMIRKMKYGGVYQMAEWMGEKMAEALLTGPLLTPDALVAVPMHPKRLRQRGYNQAKLLADHVAKCVEIPVLPAIIRTRNTRQQARLSAQARNKNMTGAFSANESASGKRILLIDDVLTTGSTATHCAKALRAAGAADVQLLVLAAAN